MKILRLPNLLIIILTQVLFRFCTVEPFFNLGSADSAMSYLDFGLLVMATILIAGGGNVINDIFDIQVDGINKPDRIIAGRIIPISKLRIYYAILTGIGIILGVYLAIKVQQYNLGFIFPIVAILLWYYSSRYQKTVITGNIIISFMSALVVVIVWLFELFALMSEPVKYVEAMGQLKMIGWIALAFAVFAFLLTLIREIIKDIEDKEGDAEFGFKTLAIVTGNITAKSIAFMLEVLMIAILAFAQYQLYIYDLAIIFWYLMIAVQTLLLYMAFHTLLAKSKEDFHFLSNVSKIIMLAGILSMQLFYISL